MTYANHTFFDTYFCRSSSCVSTLFNNVIINVGAYRSMMKRSLPKVLQDRFHNQDLILVNLVRT